MPGALSAGLGHAVPYPPASAQETGVVVGLRDKSLNIRAAVSARQEPMPTPPSAEITRNPVCDDRYPNLNYGGPWASVFSPGPW